MYIGVKKKKKLVYTSVSSCSRINSIYCSSNLPARPPSDSWLWSRPSRLPPSWSRRSRPVPLYLHLEDSCIHDSYSLLAPDTRANNRYNTKPPPSVRVRVRNTLLRQPTVSATPSCLTKQPPLAPLQGHESHKQTPQPKPPLLRKLGDYSMHLFERLPYSHPLSQLSSVESHLNS